ncbi:MAG TPA: glutamine--tRNA ligase/YqeY domain fusion protein [Candidatus Limiplasma sp.]|nr:glutamine--tRNA ligase/YqeY domain fusion protein [Candidatus Limiplasma sp.]
MEAPVNKTNFIWDFIDEDLESGRFQSVHTRFPPEPNGYLHIGHCKALAADFLTAEHYGGLCNLRFDDTNPAKEEVEFVEGIKEDIHWLGFDWKGGLFFASQYYQACYDIAVDWIKRGLAYVDEQTAEEVRENRGTLTEPGKNSPYRDRSVEENLLLFEEMKAGKHAEGSMILRMKIDMASPNMNMRDPAMYRILFKEHHRTGKEWCIYPMYDFSHPIGDAIECVTHSLCSLEYEDHRVLYEWVVEHAKDMLPGRPRQIEFSRLNLTRTIMSKRYLRTLVEKGIVAGWDDPRMPTLCAMRRRGYTPEAIRDFIDRIGLAKADSEVDFALLEHCVRNSLSETAPRAMAVLHPLKVVLTNWPEDKTDELAIENHPGHPEMGERTVTFTKELYIEQEDFMEVPARKYFRLFIGGEVRLKSAYIIKAERCDKDADGNVTCVYCTVDLSSRNGSEGALRKVKGTLHWVSATDSLPVEVRMYEPLLMEDNEEETEGKKDFLDKLNPNSLEVCRGYMENSLADAKAGDKFQFLRMGYFCKDKDSTDVLPVFNHIVGLRDTFKKVVKGSNNG